MEQLTTAFMGEIEPTYIAGELEPPQHEPSEALETYLTPHEDYLLARALVKGSSDTSDEFYELKKQLDNGEDLTEDQVIKIIKEFERSSDMKRRRNWTSR